jgi:hypothetical protein
MFLALAASTLLLPADRLCAQPNGARDPVAIARAIDSEIGKRLADEKVPASPRSDEAEFLRRVYLDITGRIPTAEHAAAFLDSADKDKRAKLIDELLARPEYGQNFGHVWRHLIIPLDTPVQTIATSPRLGEFLALQFNENPGWDKMVRRLLTRTNAGKDPPLDQLDVCQIMNVVFKQAKTGDGPPGPTTAYKARLFLGVKLLCAECHNDRFKQWTQEDYWGLVAGMAGVPAFKIPDNGESKRVGESIPARFLDGTRPAPSSAPRGSASPAFLDWMTAPENKYFAVNGVNRLWYHFFNRGLVNPVGDLHDKNPPSHPAVMDLLTREFVASGFDLKHMIRCICNSETYQRTSRAVPGNETDKELFSHMALKPLTADQLFDSLGLALGTREVNLEPLSARFNQSLTEGGPPKIGIRDRFVNFFANCKTQDDDPNDYRRGVPQQLALMNTTALNTISPAVRDLASLPPGQAIERLYLGTYSRRPTVAETRLVADYLAQRQDSDPAQGYASLLWVLLVSSEFNVVR